MAAWRSTGDRNRPLQPSPGQLGEDALDGIVPNWALIPAAFATITAVQGRGFPRGFPRVASCRATDHQPPPA
jgi:hypothetical protein